MRLVQVVMMQLNLFSINNALTPHFASSIVNKGFILLSHFCTRSRTGHVYHNNKQQQSTKTDLDTSWDLLKTLWSIKWQVESSTVWFSNFFELSILTIILKRVSVIAIYVLSTHCTVCHQQIASRYFPGTEIFKLWKE